MPAAVGATIVTAPPGSGRTFTAQRRVRLGDASPYGRVRLDALARYLQDVARDDSADADYPEPMAWLVRRTLIEATCLPRFEEWLTLTTWCSGYGGRWAERSTQIRGDRGGAVDALAVWVHINWRTGAPIRLPAEFHQVWAASAAQRRISARLVLPSRPPAAAQRLPWTLRAADLDVMNHMNNAAHWSALVEAAAHHGRRIDTKRSLRAEVEHLAPVGAAAEPALWVAAQPTGAQPSGGTGIAGIDAWLTAGGATVTAARLRAAPAPLGVT